MQTYNNFLWTSGTISDPRRLLPDPLSQLQIDPRVHNWVQAAVRGCKDASTEHSRRGESNQKPELFVVVLLSLDISKW